MAIEANETHQYQTRPLARAALQQWCEESGADIDDYVTCTAIVGGEIKHGWVVQDVADAENMVKVAEVVFGPMTVTGGDEREGECMECGKPAFIDCDGVSHHEGDSPNGVDYDADDDHVALLPEPGLAGDDDDDLSTDAIMERNAERHALTLIEAKPGLLSEMRPPVDLAEGLLICDMDAPSFDESGDVYLQLGPYLPFAAKAEAVALAKKLKEDVAIVNAAGVTILAISPTGKAKAKADKPQKPAKPMPLGSQVDEFDRPVRPVINQEKWVKTCAGHFQKIEAIAGNTMKLLAYEDSINPGDTYRKIIWLYAKNHRRYAMKYDRSPFTPEATADGWHIVYAANDDTGQMADAAD